MRNRLANWVIAALLTMQLVIGMQWQVAHANMAAPERQASGIGAQHCPDHPSKPSRTGERRDAGASTSVSSSHDNPVHHHDCCGSLDCQCHGAKFLGCSTSPWRALLVPPRFYYLSSTRGLLLRARMSYFDLPSLES